MQLNDAIDQVINSMTPGDSTKSYTVTEFRSLVNTKLGLPVAHTNTSGPTAAALQVRVQRGILTQIGTAPTRYYRVK